MTAREPIAVIGIGADAGATLCAVARGHIASASALAGGKRHLDYFPEWIGQRIVLEGDVAGFVERLRSSAERQKTVVLASGDPLFFGIGRALLDAFPRADLLFLPHVSSVQLAFARIKETWNEACVVSLHGRPLGNLLPALRRGEAKIAVLTDGKNDPNAVARLLRENGLHEYYTLWICENLGAADERVREWPPHRNTEGDFSPLNVVVLVRRQEASTKDIRAVPLVGIPETALRHRAEQRGLITKREVRLMALCYLELHPGDVVWDVGAGSGSVAIEAARLMPQVSVHAVERSTEAFAILQQNAENFRLENLQLYEGEAPEALSRLPEPDAIFVGGSGGRLVDILGKALERLRPGGRLVVNCVTLQTLGRAWQWLDEQGLRPEATSVQIAHSRPLGTLDCLEPETPLFIVRARKP